jgi:hypothetical protein
MIQHSEQINEIGAALAKAQAEIENAAKNAKNAHFNNSYADLGQILNTVRPALAKHGIGVTQSPDHADGVVTVDTLLIHSSGQWLRGTSSAVVAKRDPQAIGSATTYLRRYSLAAMCGIAQEDDDGNSARGGGEKPERRRERAPTTAPEKAGGDFHASLLETIRERAKSLPAGIEATVGKTETPDLRAFIQRNWKTLEGNVSAARQVAGVLDAADKQLTAARKRYFAALKQHAPNLDDEARAAFQQDATGKASASDWTVADFERAVTALTTAPEVHA